MTGIVRKRDTGEKGNGGEFGTLKRGEADVQIAPDAGADDATGTALIERFGFDVRTADPVEFNERRGRRRRDWRRLARASIHPSMRCTGRSGTGNRPAAPGPRGTRKWWRQRKNR